MLPAVVVDDLRTNLRRVRKLHQEHLARVALGGSRSSALVSAEWATSRPDRGQRTLGAQALPLISDRLYFLDRGLIDRIQVWRRAAALAHPDGTDPLSSVFG